MSRDLSSRILSGTAIQTFARVFAAASSFIVLLVLQRVLEREDFGLFNYYLTALTMAGAFVTFGATTVAVREISQNEASTASVISQVTRFEWISGAIAAVILASITLLREEGLVRQILIVLACTQLLSHALCAPVVLFQARLSFRLPALALIAGSFLSLTASMIAYGLGVRSFEPYLLFVCAGSFLQALLVWWNARPHLASFDKTRDRKFWPFFREMFPIGLSSVAGSLYMYLDSLMIRDLVLEGGEEAVGDYNAAYKILSFALMVPVVFCQSLFPVFARNEKDDHAVFVRVVQRSFFYAMMLGVPLAVSLQWLAPLVIGGLWDEKAQASEGVLAILAWAVLLIFVSYPLITALNAMGRQGDFMKIALGAIVVNATLNVVVIPRFGIEGAAWTTVVTEGFVFVSTLLRFMNLIGKSPFARDFWKVLVTGVVVGFVAFLLRGTSLTIAFPTMGFLTMGLWRLLGALPFDLFEDGKGR